MRRIWLAALLAGGGCLAQASRIEALPRVASINMCTDQLVLDLADPEQVMGLSPYARDQLRSREAQKAQDYPSLSGGAEEIIHHPPDLVVSSPYLPPATRSLLERRKIRIESFEFVLSIAQARAQMAQMGRLLGQETRARARIAALDARLDALRDQLAGRDLRILPVQRRGWVAGQNTLITELLTLAGAKNAAHDLGYAEGGFASIEAILSIKPDALLLTSAESNPEDQGQAKLLHPALQSLFPPERRLVIPESLTVCGGAMLAEALDLLIAQIRLVPRR